MAPRQLALRFLTGRSQDGLIPLDQETVLVGRQSGAGLVLVDKFVSLRHARLTFKGDDLVVEDLGSTNGLRGGVWPRATAFSWAVPS